MGHTIKTIKQDLERDVQSWALAGGQQLRLRIVRYRGKEYVDLRRWWLTDSGELAPGKGVRFGAELIGDVRAALVAAEELLENEDL